MQLTLLDQGYLFKKNRGVIIDIVVIPLRFFDSPFVFGQKVLWDRKLWMGAVLTWFHVTDYLFFKAPRMQ